MAPSLLDGDWQEQRRVLATVSRGPRRMSSRLWGSRRKGEPGKYGFSSHRRIPGQKGRCWRVPCATGASRTRPFVVPLWIFFSAVPQTSKRPADGGFAHRNSAHGEKELGPLGVGSPWALLEVFCEDCSRLLV